MDGEGDDEGSMVVLSLFQESHHKGAAVYRNIWTGSGMGSTACIDDLL